VLHFQRMCRARLNFLREDAVDLSSLLTFKRTIQRIDFFSFMEML